MNYWIIFLTGLTTGGLSCLAVQGGLLASVIAAQKETELENKTSGKNLAPKSFDKMDWMPVGMFLLAKLFVHILFGFLLGALGSVIALNLGVRLFFQAFAALFMFATAMNLLEIHPIFRYAAIQPPRFLRRLIYKSTRSQAFFAPLILGLLTLFIPCGVTQAMEILVIQSGSAVTGALTMGAFILGTFPLFAAIGIATAKFSEFWRKNFLRVAAYALVVMALYGFNGVLQALDAPITFQKIVALAKVSPVSSGDEAADNGANNSAVQKIVITIGNNGYTPNRLRVRAGQPVELTLRNNGAYSCASSFSLRAFGIYAQVAPNEQKTFTFTPPKAGNYNFSCSMGMYTGVIEAL